MKELSSRLIRIWRGFIYACVIISIFSVFPSEGSASQTHADWENSEWMQAAMSVIREMEYEATWQETCAIPGGAPGYHFVNREQDLRLYFYPEGVKAIRRTESQPSWVLGWSVAGGGGNKSQSLDKTAIRSDKNLLEYERDEVMERYENDKSGVMAEMIIKNPPEDSCHLRIALQLNGDISARFNPGAPDILFYQGDKPLVAFRNIRVKDAHEKNLPLTTSLDENELRVSVEDNEAEYPLRVNFLILNLPPWSAVGNQAGCMFGYSVSTAGDVNGDGYSDIIIGAPKYDNGQQDEGRAFLFYGSPTGPGVTSDWSFESDQEYAELGNAVATAGDLNADGYSDIIIGARYYSNGENNEGRAYIFLGGETGPGDMRTLESNLVDAWFGSSVAPAGDVDGDGYGDVIIGAPNYSGGKGGAYIYYGSAEVNFPRMNSFFLGTVSNVGYSVCMAGDTDRDGYGDVIIGCPSHKNDITGEGKVVALFGDATGLRVGSWSYESNLQGVNLGHSVATAGDVNGDGYADIIIGAPYYSNAQANEGAVMIFYGYSGGLGVTPLIIESNKEGAKFGSSVSIAGDWNGDGYADVIVGAPGFQRDVDHIEEGAAYIYCGSANGLKNTYDWFQMSGQPNAKFGASVSIAGDVNGDGYSDVLVGAPGYNGGEGNEGKVFLYYGKPKPPATPASWNAQNSTADCDFAIAVAGGGDVNGDGLADIMIGAPLFDNGETDEGRVFIYHGRLNDVPEATANAFVESNVANSLYGSAIAFAGDVNGDGYDDVIIGAYGFTNYQGRVYTYLGGASGIRIDTQKHYTPTSGQQHFGKSVAAAGDVNGDGYADVIVGSPEYYSGNASGFILMIAGEPSGFGIKTWTYTFPQNGSFFGTSVASAGDVNRDGYADIIVGVPGYSDGETNEGAAIVFYGSHNGPIFHSPWIVESNQEEARFGQSVSSAGDVNGDGYSDVIIGAPYYDNDQVNEGAAFIYAGGASGLSQTPMIMLDGANQNGAMFGYSVATAGDVNGDGFSDVLIGAYLRNNLFVLISDDSPSNPLLREDAGSAYLYFGSPAGPSNFPDWTQHFYGTNGHFGRCVAGAGDVNGDGFADVIIGAPGYKSSDVKYGRAYLYLGGGGNGRPAMPIQKTEEPTRFVSKMGKTDNNGCHLQITQYSPFGRGKVKTETEFKGLGGVFNGSGTYCSHFWSDLTNNTLTHVINLFSVENSVWFWRMRVLYHPVSYPYQRHGPWIAIPWNGWHEGNLRLGPTASPRLIDIINHLLGKSHYPHDINADGKTDAADLVELLLNL